MRVIDCFLFHQEIDMLNIRLHYLERHVDKFIILESSQTFSGRKKEFLFKNNRQLFKKFEHKIIYFQIDEFHSSYKEVIDKLKNSHEPINYKVLSLLNAHDHYNKNELNWVLDTYQRESLHIPLSKICNDNDLVLLSDLDEIPSIDFLKYLKRNDFENFITARQREYNIFLNLFKNPDWIGTIAGKYKYLKNHSLNLMRKDSKDVNCNYIKHIEIFGGYHFSWIGKKEFILNKLNSTGHQEVNFKLMRKAINNDIMSLRHIFFSKASLFSTLSNHYKIVDITDINFFDDSISLILQKYSNLILDRAQISNHDNRINYFVNSVIFKIGHIFNRFFKFIKKMNDRFF